MSYVRVILVCGDEAEASMSEIRLVSTWCHNCGTKRGIVDVMTQEWASRCYDCRHKKYWGANEELAKEAARRHWRKLNDHRPTHYRVTRPKSVEAREFLIKAGIITSCG